MLSIDFLLILSWLALLFVAIYFFAYGIDKAIKEYIDYYKKN